MRDVVELGQMLRKPGIGFASAEDQYLRHSMRRLLFFRQNDIYCSYTKSNLGTNADNGNIHDTTHRHKRRALGSHRDGA
jgi:hypothetical protein